MKRTTKEASEYRIITNDGYMFAEHFDDVSKAEQRAMYLTRNNIEKAFIIFIQTYTEHTKYDDIKTPLLTKRIETYSVVREVKQGMIKIIVDRAN